MSTRELSNMNNSSQITTSTRSLKSNTGGYGFMIINTLFAAGLLHILCVLVNFYTGNNYLGVPVGAISTMLSIAAVLFCLRISHSHFYETGKQGSLLSRMQAFIYAAGEGAIGAYMDLVRR
jgi:hypothetical protein